MLTGTGNGDESGATPFAVSTAWTLVSVPLDAERAHGALRAEVVVDTPGRELQIDGTSLTAAGAREGGSPRVALPAPPPVQPGDPSPPGADTLAARAIKHP